MMRNATQSHIVGLHPKVRTKKNKTMKKSFEFYFFPFNTQANGDLAKAKVNLEHLK